MLAVHSQTPTIERDEFLLHRAEIPPDDGGAIRFTWHFPPGTLRPRMSGLELATFLMEHMPAIIGCGLLTDHPRIHKEFCRIWMLFQTTPVEALDQLIPWVQSVDRRVPRKVADKFGIPKCEYDDVIVLDLNIKYVPQRTQRIFY